MKKEFSKEWKGSSQPRKQRKYLANAPMHIRKKFMSVNLSKDLRKKYGKRNVPIKKGDTVKVMRGKYEGKQGKITEVIVKRSKIMMEGIQVTKRDGSKVNVRLQPSNLQIIEMNMEGKNRIAEKTNKPKMETKKNAPQKTASS